jgi:hypothetical protein
MLQEVMVPLISNLLFPLPCTHLTLKFSIAALPDVVLVMGEELFAQPRVLVVMVLLSQ